MNRGNVYGVQKVDEPEVRDGLDIAGNVAGAAAQGAKIGNQIAGPWGGLVVGAGAGALSLVKQNQAQRKEEAMLRDAENYNEFVGNLSGRDFRTENMVRAQARYGMKSNNKYENAEIEGDGSGSAINGIGEIHVDKNYNIKNVANGGKRHEDGGFKIDNLEDDDIIFPTQNNKKEYDRVLNLINRYKLRRDPRAKKELDRMRDRLPSDADYGYDNKYPDGKGTMSYKDQLKSVIEKGGLDYTRRQLRNMTEADAEAALLNLYDQDPGAFEQTYPEIFKASGFTRSEAVPESQIQADASMPDFLASDFTKTTYEDAADIGKNTAGQTGSAVTGQGSMQQKQNVANDPQPQATPSVAAQAQKQPAPQTKKYEEIKIDNLPSPSISNEDVLSGSNQIYKAEDTPADLQKKSFDPYAKYREEAWKDVNTIDERNNPLKYTSMINKMVQGTKPADTVTRRFFDPIKQEYVDRSESKRQANLEKKNQSLLSTRGKGLSAGQKQSYADQIGAQFYRTAEAIDEGEAAKADIIAAKNIDAENMAKKYNLELENKYDEQDAMAKAVRQKYFDAAYSDATKLAMLDEQKRYMMDRDRKRNKINMMTPGLLGTSNFGFNPDDPFFVKYKSDV